MGLAVGPYLPVCRMGGSNHPLGTHRPVLSKVALMLSTGQGVALKLSDIGTPQLSHDSPELPLIPPGSHQG